MILGVRRNFADSSDSRWRCDSCGKHVEHETVRDLLNVNWDMLESVEKEDNDGLEEVIEAFRSDFHEHHFYILEAKRRVIENIMDYEDVATPVLDKKIDYCRDHLLVQSRVAPGLSEYRAYISWHLAEPLYWASKDKFVQKLISSSQLMSQMEEVARHLLIVIQIWGPYRRRSSEWMTAEKARTLLEIVDDKYLHRNLRLEAEEVLREKKLKTYNNINSL